MDISQVLRKYLFAVIFYFFSTIQSSMAAGTELHIIYTYGQETMGNILGEFETNTGVHIKAEFMDQSDLKDRIMGMIELHKEPDAVIMPADHVGLHSFIKYSEIESNLFKASISERIWAGGMSDGKLYGAPLIQGNHLMLYYNKSFVKEPARDWQDMFAQQHEFEAKGIPTIAWSYDGPFWLLPFLGAFGGWPLNNGNIELNTPAMATALDFYKGLRVKKLLHPNCNYQCSIDLFKTNKLAYTINGEWVGVDFFKALGDKLGVSAIPTADGKKMLSAFSIHVIAFPNNSLNGEKRSDLIQLVNYLQSQKIQQQIWAQMGAIPVEKNAFAYAQKNAQGYLKQTLVLMADTKPLPADQAMSFIWDAIDKGFISHREGVLDSKGAALYMQQLAERNLRNAQKQTKLHGK